MRSSYRHSGEGLPHPTLEVSVDLPESDLTRLFGFKQSPNLQRQRGSRRCLWRFGFCLLELTRNTGMEVLRLRNF